MEHLVRPFILITLLSIFTLSCAERPSGQPSPTADVEALTTLANVTLTASGGSNGDGTRQRTKATRTG